MDNITIDDFNGKLTKSAVKIVNKILFKSNKVVSNGQDKLIVFDLCIKKVISSNIDNTQYSFIYSAGGLTCMNVERVLLCACKKYLRQQKNGILLLHFQNDKYKDNICENIKYKFYPTKNFEVYCFCPISKYNKRNILDNKINKEDTDYFFVGGFNHNLRKGIIKLYKLIYDKEVTKVKIEYIQDIIVTNNKNVPFKRFNGPISCITQSTIDGKILITCWDGNIYFFEIPDISYYLRI